MKKLWNKIIKGFFIIIGLGFFVGYEFQQNPIYAELAPGVNISYDQNGIPSAWYGDERGWRTNPLTIAFHVEDWYESYLKSGNQTELQYAINNADWLVENKIDYGNYSIYEYDFDFHHGMVPPWRSAMASGVAIQAMILADQITNDPKYMNIIDDLLNAFFVEVQNGGITYKYTPDSWWYLTYADETGVNSRVLNGHNYVLLALYDLWTYDNNTYAKLLFNKGINSLVDNIQKYDAGNGNSIYDLHYKWHHGRFYGTVVIDQLGDLYQITKEPELKKYRDKWDIFRVLYLNRNEPPTNLWDLNGNFLNNVTTSSNGIEHNIEFVSSQFNKGIKTNGVNSYVKIPVNESIKPQSITISSWIKTSNPSQTNKLHPIVIYHHDEQHGYKLSWDTRDGWNVVWCAIGDGHQGHYHRVFANSNFGPTEVHHVVCTYEDSTIQIYLDGELKREKTIPGLGGSIAYHADHVQPDLHIGGNWWNRYYSDLEFIDNVQIYPRVVSAFDIQEMHKLGD